MTDGAPPPPKLFHCARDDSERRIEKFLFSHLGSSKDHVSKLLRQGRVRAGERVFARGDRLGGRETVEVHPGPLVHPPPQPNRKVRFKVLYEDPDLIGVFKPAGVAMHPGPGHGNDTLLNGLITFFPELVELGAAREYGLVQRLDLDTSGVLVVARTPTAYEALIAAFSARAVAKEYLALVVGAPPEPSGEVTTPVGDKEACTAYELVETAGPLSLVRARPKTGRTHQVRIHLAQLGCAVLADRKHGAGLDEHTAWLYLKRLALHARSLELAHPTSGEPFRLESELPKGLRKAWSRAQKLASS